MTFPILASLLVRLVVLLPFQLLRLSLATPSRWTPLALSVCLHCVVRSEERFSRNAETDLVCRLLLETKNKGVGAQRFGGGGGEGRVGRARVGAVAWRHGWGGGG